MTEIVIGGDMEDIPEGTYPATVKSIETKESTAFGEFRAWDFQLENGSVVGGASSMATSSKSKGGRWIRALLGRKPEKGESVNLIGRPCLVVVAEKEGWPNVTDVLPTLATNGTSQAPVSRTPEPEPAALPELP